MRQTPPARLAFLVTRLSALRIALRARLSRALNSRAGAAVAPVLAGFWRLLGRLVPRPTRLRSKFMAVGGTLLFLVLLQSAIGIGIARQSRAILEGTTAQTDGAMADLGLAATLKNMQVQVLLTQTLMGTLSVAEPAELNNSLRAIATTYAAGLEEVRRVAARERAGGTAENNPLGDVATKVQMAKTQFDALQETAMALKPLAGKTVAPADQLLKLSAQVDGLNDHLDRMAEAMKLVAKGDQAQVRAGNQTALGVIDDLNHGIQASTALGLILCGLAALFLMRGVLSPLLAVAGATRDLAGGQLDVALPAARKDEIGEMVDSLSVFRDNARAVERLNVERDQERARAEEMRRRALEDTAHTFETKAGRILGSVTEAAHGLVETARAVSRTAAGASTAASAAETAAQSANGTIQGAVSAAEQLRATTADVLESVAEAAKLARTTADSTKGTSELIERLTAASRRITDVVALIQTIAGQTNLLALNATIEAARAGEAGRGFAVVASEVKGLAGQTAQATQDIQQEIAAMQAAIAQAVQAFREIVAAVMRIDQVNDGIARTITDQARATQAIAVTMTDAAQGVTRVGGDIGTVARAANDTGLATNQVFTASSDLSVQAKELQRAVSDFLSAIVAA
ncbi:methyl-accepting chemotaxis protein [Nitrospirillum bahiense]|uniref:Methyl-accepting chemotaxis protein n=1 Tax=Nitrospirillum amazonense TaxID=28077 RepID=A0A560GB62_9PROT|nr:HAMP domain-containing methyl-accepting chemotaxis protein [Nitrospirillum amazonense]TWB30940.1 methyl-accepting chemotaxis protein [Nitrospirillum amazonense]